MDFMKWMKKKIQLLYKVLTLTILLCGFSLLTYTDQDTVPPMLKRPDESNSSHQEVTVEVRAFKVTQENGGTVIIPSQNEDDSSLIKGKDAISFLTSVLGVSGIEEVFQETQQITDTYDDGNHFIILPELNFYIKKLEGDENSRVFTLQTRVTIKKNEHEVDAIRATAKAQVGEPLVFTGIEINTEKYIILATLKQPSDEKSNQDANSSQKENEQEKDEKQEPKSLEEQDTKDSSDKEQNDQKDNKESQQILLLLESLEDTDQQEQKEMLNRREKIQLEEKWW